MRVLMTGGGTGGHVYPALAIAEIIKTNVPDAEIAFVGTERGIENKLVPQYGYKLYHVEIQGIERSLSLKNIKTAYLVLVSPHKAKRIIEGFRPDLVIGTGGYVCWPLLKAAAAMGIPSMVHESNASPGLAVKQVQKHVDKILTCFDETSQKLKCREKVVKVGNPIRLKYTLLDKAEAREKLNIPADTGLTVLSFGGSLGAKGINDTALSIMESFTPKHCDVKHIHVTGTRFYESFGQQIRDKGITLNENTCIKDYLHDMPLYMAAADVVICRAGAMTLAELAMIGKPAILIPSPNVTDDHQFKNANVIASGGGAVLISEDGEMGARVLETLERMYSDRKYLEDMGMAMKSFARPDAGKNIYGEITRLLSARKKKSE